jgi:hypothetical protein
MPRMMSVTVCVPAIPPMLATIGMRAASAATFSMVPSKRLTTAAARNAVIRLMPSHTSAARVEGITPRTDLLHRADPPRT